MFFLFEKRAKRFILDTTAAASAEVVQISREKEFVNFILAESVNQDLTDGICAAFVVLSIDYRNDY